MTPPASPLDDVSPVLAAQAVTHQERTLKYMTRSEAATATTEVPATAVRAKFNSQKQPNELLSSSLSVKSRCDNCELLENFGKMEPVKKGQQHNSNQIYTFRARKLVDEGKTSKKSKCEAVEKSPIGVQSKDIENTVHKTVVPVSRILGPKRGTHSKYNWRCLRRSGRSCVRTVSADEAETNEPPGILRDNKESLVIAKRKSISQPLNAAANLKKTTEEKEGDSGKKCQAEPLSSTVSSHKKSSLTVATGGTKSKQNELSGLVWEEALLGAVVRKVVSSKIHRGTNVTRRITNLLVTCVKRDQCPIVVEGAGIQGSQDRINTVWKSVQDALGQPMSYWSRPKNLVWQPPTLPAPGALYRPQYFADPADRSSGLKQSGTSPNASTTIPFRASTIGRPVGFGRNSLAAYPAATTATATATSNSDAATTTSTSGDRVTSVCSNMNKDNLRNVFRANIALTTNQRRSGRETKGHMPQRVTRNQQPANETTAMRSKTVVSSSSLKRQEQINSETTENADAGSAASDIMANLDLDRQQDGYEKVTGVLKPKTMVQNDVPECPNFRASDAVRYPTLLARLQRPTLASACRVRTAVSAVCGDPSPKSFPDQLRQSRAKASLLSKVMKPIGRNRRKKLQSVCKIDRRHVAARGPKTGRSDAKFPVGKLKSGEVEQLFDGMVKNDLDNHRETSQESLVSGRGRENFPIKPGFDTRSEPSVVATADTKDGAGAVAEQSTLPDALQQLPCTDDAFTCPMAQERLLSPSEEAYLAQVADTILRSDLPFPESFMVSFVRELLKTRRCGSPKEMADRDGQLPSQPSSIAIDSREQYSERTRRSGRAAQSELVVDCIAEECFVAESGNERAVYNDGGNPGPDWACLQGTYTDAGVSDEKSAAELEPRLLTHKKYGISAEMSQNSASLADLTTSNDLCVRNMVDPVNYMRLPDSAELGTDLGRAGHPNMGPSEPTASTLRDYWRNCLMRHSVQVPPLPSPSQNEATLDAIVRRVFSTQEGGCL
jgi:hypothetical protein